MDLKTDVKCSKDTM